MNIAAIPLSVPALDRVNRRAYANPRVLRQFGEAKGWLDAGEQNAIAMVAESARGTPVLDLGVGGGRTAPLLRTISNDYRGIDYAPAMVAVSRQRFPDLAFLEMDARKLAFPDNMFGLVTFSYNGIDSIDLAGRLQVLREVRRVLRPDGHFVFSALNRQSAAAARRWPDWSVFRQGGRSGLNVVRGFAKLALGGFNRLRLSYLVQDAPDHSVGHISAHNFGLVALFTSVNEQVRQLHETGFTIDAILDAQGVSLATDGRQTTDAAWCYYVARKPAAAGSA